MNILKREIEKDVIESLIQPEAVFILGARQVGKTSLMKKIMSELNTENVLYLDLENPQNLLIIDKGLNEFLEFLEFQNFKKNEKAFIFIDEIQYAKDFSGMLKYLVDHHSNQYKFILSGSSSLQIKQQFKESLVGRKIVFELFPLTFAEFCLFKNEENYFNHLVDIDTFSLRSDPVRFERTKIQLLLKEFLIFGGFPKAVLKNNPQDKISVLNDIVQSYILKDIRHIFKLEKVEQFNHLVKLLASISGKELNISNLSNETKLHKQTLEHYMEALESGYIIKLIKPFHRNINTELKKTPKCFFIDNGLRNMLINNFNEIDFRPDRGELLESFVFSQLLKKSNSVTKINFWRTKSKQEVDFILQENDKLKAIEVKWSSGSRKHLNKFKKVYPTSEDFVVSFMQEFAEVEKLIPGYLV